MSPEQLKEQILMHLNAGSSPEDSVLTLLQNYKGSDEFLLGAQAFLLDHGKEDLQSLHKNLPNYKSAKSRKVFWYAAASILAIFFLALVWSNYSEDPYLKVEEGTAVFMGGESTSLNDFMNAYRTGDYKNAIAFGKEKIKTQSSDTLFFYMGCAFNYVGDFQQAITHFRDLKEGSKYLAPALYQKAYAFYKLNQVDSARFFLRSMPAFERDQSPQAIQLLRVLE